MKYFEKLYEILQDPPPPKELLKHISSIKSSNEYKIIQEYLKKLHNKIGPIDVRDYATKQVKNRKVNYEKYLIKVYDTGVLKSGGSINDMEPSIQKLIENNLGGDCLGSI